MYGFQIMWLISLFIVSVITEAGNSTRSFCEHSGRTLPTGRDVTCALADIGFSNKHLVQYYRRPRRMTLAQCKK